MDLGDDPMELAGIVPWGRSFAEYARMFILTGRYMPPPPPGVVVETKSGSSELPAPRSKG